jgi:hypothetical protein
MLRRNIRKEIKEDRLLRFLNVVSKYVFVWQRICWTLEKAEERQTGAAQDRSDSRDYSLEQRKEMMSEMKTFRSNL